ncbi:nascent polypeptide-associated complex, alpha subunit [Neoconidiobolus thromboides FSU 785]|nr:nascent polypeptide-associated complex, alpha subunit [Neoconidiobolus thromboides FSU 785]
MADTQNNNESVQNSRIEKKAKKVMAQLNLTPVTSINRVVFRRPKGMMLAVSEPQVFKSADSNIYVVLGEAKTEDLNLQAQQAAQERLRAAEQSKLAADTEAPTAEAPVAEDEEEVDETGVDAKDVELVMTQASVSRAKAVKALKENSNDLVNAIMALTT